MGKAQSTELGGGGGAAVAPSNRTDGTKDANGGRGVQMRKDKAGGGKRTKQNRPTSYPGPSSPADSAVSSSTTTTDKIPVFNRASHNPSLAGRHSQAFEENFTLSPISEIPVEQYPAGNSPVPVTPAADPNRTFPPTSAPTGAGKPVNAQDPIASSSRSPTTTRTMRDCTTQTFRASNQQKEELGRALDRLIVAFPKYKDLRYIGVDSMDSSAIESLRDFCVKIADYRSETEAATRRQMEILAGLEEQCADQDRRLKWQDAEIVRLNELVSSLSSPQQQDPGYTSAGSDDLEERTRKSSSSQRNAPKLSDDSIDLDDSARFRPRGREGGIYKATPLVIAEGEEGSKAVVRRTNSLKPVGLDHRNVGYERPMSTLYDEDPVPPDGDVDEKLRWLERSLERERRENIYLRDRLKSKGGAETQESIYEVLPSRKGGNQEAMVDRYRRLEEHAIGRLFASIKRQMATVSDKRRSQFICAVIENSYTVALSSILHFPDVIHSLLINPVQALNQRTDGPQRINPAAKPVRERSRPGQSGDLHESLVRQLIAYLQQTADVTDLTSLAENVCDGLRRNYSDCFSSALLGQRDFRQFLDDCCRLAWQMAVTTPPLYLSTDSLRMDDRIHGTLMQDEVTNAQVDHYLWPTLFEHRNGNVLYKGRVVIKTMAVNL